MQKYMFRHGLLVVSVLLMMLVSACQKSPELPPDTFTGTWSSTNGRVITITGIDTVHEAGSRAEFQVEFKNQMASGSWTTEYDKFLLYTFNNTQEKVGGGDFDLKPGMTMKATTPVDFPEGYEGTLGLLIQAKDGGAIAAYFEVEND